MADKFAGLFERCPDTPNCVSTQADPGDEEHYVSPLEYNGERDPVPIILELVNDMKRTTLVNRSDSYLHLEVRSRVFRFVDDLEIYYDRRAGLIHFRSAARLGRGDFGVNRRRVTSLKETLQNRL